MRNCGIQVKSFEANEVRMTEDGRTDIYAKAKANRVRIKNGLKANSDPKPTGMRTQGSYAMRTMIVYQDGDYDIDDGVYFLRDDLKGSQGGDMSALDARNMVCKAAQDDRFNVPPEVRKNCVRVFYNDGYHVDIPTYRESRKVDPISGATTSEFELASSDWRKSDALAVTDWFKARNKTLSKDSTKNGNDGQFVRVVRLAKCFARSRDSWKGKIASGFAISKLVSDHFLVSDERDDVALRSTLKAVSAALKINTCVKHPTLDENIAEHGDARITYFNERLTENLEHLEVLDKDGCTHSDAMKAWDNFFNSGWFSDQPDPEEDEGIETKSKIGPTIKGGQTRYASEFAA